MTNHISIEDFQKIEIETYKNENIADAIRTIFTVKSMYEGHADYFALLISYAANEKRFPEDDYTTILLSNHRSEFSASEKEFFKKYPSYLEIEELERYCKLYGVEVEFVPFLVRGLSYYNGNVFEIKF